LIGKEPLKVNQKAEKLNSDIYIEDLELLNQTIAEKSLTSRKEGLHYWANIVRDVPNSEKEPICQYRFGCFCTNEPKPQKKLRKTTDEYCQACMQAQKNKALQDEVIDTQHAVFDLVGMPHRYRVDPFYRWDFFWDWILNEWDNVKERLDELEKTPVGEYIEKIGNTENELEKSLTEKRQLENKISMIKQQFEKEKDEILETERQQRATLETDNIFLKEELEKLKHEPIFEKNAWLTVELQQANQKIAKLEAQIQQQRGEAKWAYSQ
jgi:hypothetical protein